MRSGDIITYKTLGGWRIVGLVIRVTADGGGLCELWRDGKKQNGTMVLHDDNSELIGNIEVFDVSL